jgi:protein transport protein SEC24
MEYDQSQAGQKKKRAYAQQAYEFGQNTPQGGQQMPQQQPPPPMMGGMGAPLGGAPQIPVAAGAPQDQLSNQFGQMNLQQPQQAQQGYMAQQPQQQSMQQPVQQVAQGGYANQNQLLPSDLMATPFMVHELDNPPPPINLPPNVSLCFLSYL